MDENKKRALDAAILKIEKDFGKGAVMRLGDPNAMGNGGCPEVSIQRKRCRKTVLLLWRL